MSLLNKEFAELSILQAVLHSRSIIDVYYVLNLYSFLTCSSLNRR